jgi:hypothetical protein
MYSYDRYLALFLLGFVGSCLASPLDPIRRQVTGSANPVPASNAIQSSIINQQAYNLCLYEKSLSKIIELAPLSDRRELSQYKWRKPSNRVAETQ